MPTTLDLPNLATKRSLFAAAGIADVKPRVNVLTYNKWIAAGRLVRKGEKAVKVGPFALFHVSQTDPLPVGSVVGAEQTAATN